MSNPFERFCWLALRPPFLQGDVLDVHLRYLDSIILCRVRPGRSKMQSLSTSNDLHEKKKNRK